MMSMRVLFVKYECCTFISWGHVIAATLPGRDSGRFFGWLGSRHILLRLLESLIFLKIF
jgi:hypothetical protein